MKTVTCARSVQVIVFKQSGGKSEKYQERKAMEMRNLRGKGKWLLLLCAVLTLGAGSMTSMAAASIKIRFDNGNKRDWTEDITEPKVTINNSEVSPEWSQELEKWTPGKKITATFTIPGSYTRSSCSVYGGELVSARPSEDGDETVIKASYIPVVKLGAPETAGWSDSVRTKATWKKVPYASKYQLALYEGDEWIKNLTASTTSIDLVEYMRDGYSYYYEVRAVAKDSAQEKYLQDGDIVASEYSAVQELGDTTGRWSTYQDGKKYREDDGNYVTSTWKMISGKWYYFNEAGYVQTGWVAVGGKWYYTDSDGVMQTGWQEIGGKWYYLNQTGEMATGWVQPEPGKYYYLYEDGSMASNTVIDNQYRLDVSGLWVP